MRLIATLATALVLVPAVAIACEDYQSSASANVPASLASSTPAASKAPVAMTRKTAMPASKQATAKTSTPADKQVVAARKE